MRRSWIHATAAAALLGAVTFAPGALGASDVVEVIDFDYALRTAQGGWYGCTGARPDGLQDRLLSIGDPAAGAWKLTVTADASDRGVGGVVPLYDNRSRDGSNRLLDLSGMDKLELRLIGELGERTLRVELVTGRDAKAADLAEVKPDQLDSAKWRTISAALPDAGIDRSAGQSIRLMLEGRGPGWVAIDVLRFAADDAPAMTAPTVASPQPMRTALWVWRTNRYLAEAGRTTELLAFCRKHQVTDLFWQVPYNKYKDQKIELFLNDEQRAFNRAAHEQGLKVHALDGGPQFVLRENHERVLKLVDALDAFNQASEPAERYDGVHMDNEPYVLPQWKESDAVRQEVIQQYIELNQALKKKVHAAKMVYGVDIPFWWDKENEPGKRAFMVLTGKGETPLLEATFACVDNAGIMSYRQRVIGPNSVVECAATECALGAETGVDVFASVEIGIGPRVEAGISFGEYSPEYFVTQLDTLRRVLPHQEGCAGLAIHAFYSMEEFLERLP